MPKKLKLKSLKSLKSKKKVNLSGGGKDLKIELLFIKLTPETIEKWHNNQTDFFSDTRKHLNNSFEHTDENNNVWTMKPLVSLPSKTSIYWIFQKNDENNYYLKRLSGGNFVGGIPPFSKSQISKFSDETLKKQVPGNVQQIITAGLYSNLATYTLDEITALQKNAHSKATFIDNSKNNTFNHTKKSGKKRKPTTNNNNNNNNETYVPQHKASKMNNNE